MYREFGSEFWIDEKHRIPRPERSFLFEPDEIFIDSGRSALSLILDQKKDLPRKALLPTYTCMTVTQPFAGYGFETLYYDIDRNMQPDIAKILETAEREPVIFVHMGHFGFPTNQPLKEVLPRLNNLGCVIIEDTSHNLFYEGSPLPSHCRVSSLRKWLGIPSGGIVFPDRLRDILRSTDAPAFDDFYHPRALAMKEKKDLLEGRTTASLKKDYLALFGAAEEALNRDITPYSIDKESLGILFTTDFAYLRKQRRENYTYLLQNFPQTVKMQPVFSSLPPECCPLFFPVLVDEDNRRYQKQLAAQNLFCPIHWPQNPYIQDHYDGLTFWENHILSIPCDQRYAEADMEKIIAILSDVCRKN